MKAIGERDDVLPPGDLARQFDGRLHHAGARGRGELHFVRQRPWLKNDLAQVEEKLLLGPAVHVQRRLDPVTLQVVDYRCLDRFRVVTIVDRAGAT